MRVSESDTCCVVVATVEESSGPPIAVVSASSILQTPMFEDEDEGRLSSLV